MPAKKLVTLTAVLLPLASPLAAAPQPDAPEQAVLVVGGLAKDDLLNIRATASATGMVIGRLPNGAALKNFGCDEVNGYKWCKITAVDDETVNGWTPARYLQGLADAPPASAAPSAGVQAEAVAPVDPLAVEDAADLPVLPDESPVPTPSPAAFAAAPEATEPPSVQVASVEPVLTRPGELSVQNADLSARLGDTAPASAVLPASVIESAAVASAFRTAFAAPVPEAPAPDNAASTGSIERPAPPQATPVPPAAPAPVETAAIPAPHPVKQPEPSAPIPALAGPASAGATGEVPCARYIGQAMTRCAAVVSRIGAEDADVTVTLPDGGRRTIRFRAAMPEGSNSRGAFRFSREGDLNMIRVGTSERFEIPDAVAFGE